MHTYFPLSIVSSSISLCPNFLISALILLEEAVNFFLFFEYLMNASTVVPAPSRIKSSSAKIS